MQTISHCTSAAVTYTENMELNPPYALQGSSNVQMQPLAPENTSFWKKYPGLVWSNRKAGDAVRIRAALLRPSFPVLLDIASHFSLNRLEEEWAVLQGDSMTDTRRVEPTVARILSNLRRGYEQARA